MPELPEVQTIVDDLNKKVVGRRITGVWFDWPKAIRQSDGSLTHADDTRTNAEKFQKTIQGKKILGVWRRAKNILIYLSSEGNKSPRSPLKSAKSATHILLIHLKMTGHLLVGKWSIQKAQPSPAARGTRKRPHELVIPLEPKEAVDDPYNRFIHLIFYLDNGKMLGYSDLRKFGKAILGTKEQIENLPELKKLGPEPLASSFTINELKSLISQEKRKIKQVLLDQEVIAGIGNIYSDDILWKAKIHPFKSANKLTDKELKELWKAMREVLTKAVKLRGTSTSDYRDTAGKKGGYTEERLAYQREGEPCRRCGTKIKRVKISGRSAHYCPACQRLTP